MDLGHLPPPANVDAKLAVRGRSIGAILVDARKLAPSDAEAVLHYARENGTRFGDAAVRLGCVSAADVQHALALQYDYPYLAQQDAGISKEVIAAYAPFSPPVEALRAMRMQLMLRWFDADKPHIALAVVSAARGDGRSYVAANLAVVLSQLGKQTLLVDADLRNPRQHRIFNLEDRVGLSALLSGRGDNGAIHRIPGLVSLSVLPAGAIPPNPQELLGRPGFGTLIKELELRFDAILIDTPAAALGADFQAVSLIAKGSVLVARRNATRTADAQAVSSRIASAGAVVIGAVLNEH